MSIDARTIIGHAAKTAVTAISNDVMAEINAEVAPISFEGLEGRQLMTGVSLAGHTLMIEGMNGADDIHVSLSKDGHTLSAKLNGGKTQNFDAGNVWAINVKAGNGNNRINIDPAIIASVGVTTGTGNDTIITGSGSDHISSGYGSDIVSTGLGNDWVDAGTGNDKVNLGAGNDLVNGGSGNDTVQSGDGWDQLFGRKGNDTIYAKPGDLIDPGAGRNSVERNAGTPVTKPTKLSIPSITKLSLVNADTGVTVSGYETLWTGMTLDMAKLPAHVTIVAQISGDVQSARFKLSDNSIDTIDNSSAYSLGTWTPAAGKTVTLTVTPYTADDANGQNGSTTTMQFAVKRATPVPTPDPTPDPTPTPTPTPADVNTPTINLNPLQTTVVAGQAYHIEATRTVVPGYQIEDAKFAWDFGDAYGRFNTMPGFNAAHVYETPGNYTVKLTVTAPGGQVSVQRMTVNVVASNYKFVYVAANGDDSADGSSSGNAVRTFSRALSLAGDNTQILLKRGDTFAITSQQELNRNNLVVTSYGSGTNPTILWTGGRSSFNGMFSVPATAANVTIRGLTFNSIYSTDTEQTNMPHAILNGGTAVTIRDNTFLNVGYAINNNAQPHGVLVMDNKVPLLTGVRGYFCWTQGSDFVIVGNKVANVTREHVVRVGGADRLNIAYNDFTNLDRVAQGDVRDTAKGAIVVQQGSYAYIAYNQIHGPLGVGPLGGADGLGKKSARFYHAAVEGNVEYAGTFFVNHGAQNVTLRGNTITNDNGVAIDIAPYDASFGRGVVDVVVDHNVGINNGTQGNFMWVEGETDGITVTNNVYVAPSLRPGSFGAAALFINDNDLSSFRRIDGNVWPSPDRGNAYARGGMIFLGKSYTSANHRTLSEWNSMAQVGTDYFTDVQLDNADDTLVMGLQPALLKVA